MEKESMTHKILKYLYYEDAINRNRIDITGFLIDAQNQYGEPDTDLGRISKAIQLINDKQFAYIIASPIENVLQKRNAAGIISNLNNTTFTAEFTIEGYDYIHNYIQKIEQHNSVIKVNNSSKKLNDEVLPGNFRIQTQIGNRNLAILGVYTLFTLASIITTLTIRDTQTPQLMKQQVQYLDSLTQTFRSLNISLKKIYIFDSLAHIKDTTKKISKHDK